MTIRLVLDRKKWCHSCRVDIHAECDHHMNRGAVDAEEFVNIRCKCPCDGGVAEGSRLISLVLDLRNTIDQLEDEISDQKAKLEGRIPVELIAGFRRFFARSFNDEGRLLSVSRERAWFPELRRLRELWDDFQTEEGWHEELEELDENENEDEDDDPDGYFFDPQGARQ